MNKEYIDLEKENPEWFQVMRESIRKAYTTVTGMTITKAEEDSILTGHILQLTRPFNIDPAVKPLAASIRETLQ